MGVNAPLVVNILLPYRRSRPLSAVRGGGKGTRCEPATTFGSLSEIQRRSRRSCTQKSAPAVFKSAESLWNKWWRAGTRTRDLLREGSALVPTAPCAFTTLFVFNGLGNLLLARCITSVVPADVVLVQRSNVSASWMRASSGSLSEFRPSGSGIRQRRGLGCGRRGRSRVPA